MREPEIKVTINLTFEARSLRGSEKPRCVTAVCSTFRSSRLLGSNGSTFQQVQCTNAEYPLPSRVKAQTLVQWVANSYLVLPQILSGYSNVIPNQVKHPLACGKMRRSELRCSLIQLTRRELDNWLQGGLTIVNAHIPRYGWGRAESSKCQENETDDFLIHVTYGVYTVIDTEFRTSQPLVLSPRDSLRGLDLPRTQQSLDTPMTIFEVCVPSQKVGDCG